MMGPCIVAACARTPFPSSCFCAECWGKLSLQERRDFGISQFKLAAALLRGDQTDFDRSRLLLEGIAAALAARIADRRTLEIIIPTEGAEHAARTTP